MLLEESVIGWKEFEMEVVRDRNDNCIIVCSIENLDPMGIHTGDSITVAPAQTLTDKEYQRMRDASIAVLRKIGVDTGGSNVQFALSPDDGRLLVIEMNPRVSRSSALASKATGFPIAKVAAKLAVGYTLDELRNEITGGATPASFEPTIDYVVTKMPRFTFEKFPQAADRLTTQMKSVGEVMAIGRTFQESLQKALRGLETGIDGFDPVLETVESEEDWAKLKHELRMAGSRRLWYVADAFRFGLGLDEVAELTCIDRWFLAQIEELVAIEADISAEGPACSWPRSLRALKRRGFSDRRLGDLIGVKEKNRENSASQGEHKARIQASRQLRRRVRERHGLHVLDLRGRVRGRPDRPRQDHDPGRRPEPDRPGHRVRLLLRARVVRAARRPASRPSWSTATRRRSPRTTTRRIALYFEPLTLEDVLEIVHKEQPEGVIVQYGGQTPLKLARALEEAGVPIIGTSPDSIDLAEDRERFQQLVNRLKLKQPPNRTARNAEDAVALAQGGRVSARRAAVLRARRPGHGDRARRGRAARIRRERRQRLQRQPDAARPLSRSRRRGRRRCDLRRRGGHHRRHHGARRAGRHPFRRFRLLAAAVQPERRDAGTLSEQVRQLAQALQVIGIMNTQFAIQNGVIYVLEVNPRASRTVPVRVEGHRAAAREDRGEGDGRNRSFAEQGVKVPGQRPYFVGQGIGVSVHQSFPTPTPSSVPR